MEGIGGGELLDHGAALELEEMSDFGRNGCGR